MPYAVRDSQGRIQSLHRHDPGVGEAVAADDPAVRAFLGLAGADGPEAGSGAGSDTSSDSPSDAGTDADGFNRLDADFIRVLEDVIDALTSRNVINITDLPDVAQTKLFARKSFRERRPQSALRLFEPGEMDQLI